VNVKHKNRSTICFWFIPGAMELNKYKNMKKEKTVTCSGEGK